MNRTIYDVARMVCKKCEMYNRCSHLESLECRYIKDVLKEENEMVVENGNCKCVVCGSVFPLEARGHYICRDDGSIGVVTMFKAQPEEQLYDAFDCPVCGCQNVIQKRKRTYIATGIEVDEEAELETEAEDDSDTLTKAGTLQKLREVKDEIENVNQLSGAGMVKIVEALEYLVREEQDG